MRIEAKNGDIGADKRFVALVRDVTERKEWAEALRATNAELEALIDVSPLAIMMLDADGNVQLWNPSAERIFGWSAQEVVGRPNPIVPPSKESEYTLDAILISEDTASSNLETVRQRKDGTPIDVSISSAPVHANNGAVIGRMAIIADITERKRSERAEYEQRALAEALSNSAAALNSTLNFEDVLDRILDYLGPVVPHDSAGIILLDESRQNAEIVRYRDLRPDPVDMRGTKFDVPQTRNLQEMLATGEPFTIDDTRTYEGWITSKANPWTRASLSVPIRIKNEVIGFVFLSSATPGIFSPADAERLQAFVHHAAIAIENARLYAEVRKLATMDALTGLHNRLWFSAELLRLESCREFPVSVISADLDNLKTINDSLGHAAGDELIKRAAHLLRETFRAQDMIARTGGDEFVVLLPKTDAGTAAQIVSRTRERIADHNRKYPDLPVEISLGMATAEQGRLEETFNLADKRMYIDKALRKPPTRPRSASSNRPS